MKKIYILIFAVVLFTSCKKTENLDRDIVGLGGDTWAKTDLDNWLYDTFTKPYNINVKYKWDGTEYDNTKTLVPADIVRVKPLMEMVKSAWIDPYAASVNQNFIKTYAPKNYVLVGSLSYNASGTVTLGEAEGGIKITLFNVNNFTSSNRAVAKRVLKTIHHEFVHILNQTVIYQKEFPLVTPSGYTSDWNNSSAFAANGFITQYAQAAPGEDFAEMASIMLTDGKLAYEATLTANTNATAVANIRAKEALVVAYYKQTWGIDFYTLQNRVQAALNNTASEDVTTYLGVGKAYTSVAVNPDATTGMSADFMSAYAAAKTGLNGLASRVLNNFSLVYTTAGQAILRVNYVNSAGSAFVANFTYNVATDSNGIIKFTLASSDGNAGVIAPGVTALTNYLTQNQFKYKFFYSSDFSSMYVGLVKSTDANSYFFGTLGN
jgi:substrate import-associated zinc metallohydrolase lipoprotein